MGAGGGNSRVKYGIHRRVCSQCRAAGNPGGPERLAPADAVGGQQLHAYTSVADSHRRVAGESFMRQIAADDGYSKNPWNVNGLVSLAPRDLISCSCRTRDYPNRLVSFTCGLRLLYEGVVRIIIVIKLSAGQLIIGFFVLRYSLSPLQGIIPI